MSAAFEPKIVAYVCNWCTYLGADLAGTNRLEYPPNVRIVRLPCTGRIDFNLIVKALEIGADAVLVSGCHPADCHYTAGNYHARRRWIMFRRLLDTLGIELDRIHFTWISAAEGKKWQQVVTEITEKTRQLGPYTAYREIADRAHLALCEPEVSDDAEAFEEETAAPVENPPWRKLAALHSESAAAPQLRATARRLLEEGSVQVVIGYGRRRNGGAANPVFITRPEETERLTWDAGCSANLTAYLTRKEIKALGNAAVVVKGCDERALVVLEKEAQVERGSLHVIGMACNGLGDPLAPKCRKCQVRVPRFADELIGEARALPAPSGPPPADPLAALMALTPGERWAFWKSEFSRCVKCYACRQVCPLCYCERCIADKNRPTTIDTSASLKGNFAWHITRAFHLAARCIGCGECTRACPAAIPLGLLNRSLAEAASGEFAYQPGMDPAAEPVFGAWSPSDKEDFIQ